MKIAIITPYGDAYSDDRLFDLSKCTIGQNLLLPGIELKKELEKLGHEYHTIDRYKSLEEIDIWIFQDLNNNSWMTINSFMGFIKYIIKRKWRYDYYYKLHKQKHTCKSILIMQEPPSVFDTTYDKRFHKVFDRILTWDSSLIDKKKYFPFFYPQVMPEKIAIQPFSSKKLVTMICGNKHSTDKNELYSKRLEVIQYFENNNIEFDLYGFGWDNNNRTSYLGKVDEKLSTMSRYKFSICFENMKSELGYITEKIFDAFFSGCVPIYYGASNITDYVPSDTFIDFRNYNSLEELTLFLKNMNEFDYNKILYNIEMYLKSDLFLKTFSIDAYVNRMVAAITRWDKNEG